MSVTIVDYLIKIQLGDSMEKKRNLLKKFSFSSCAQEIRLAGNMLGDYVYKSSLEKQIHKNNRRILSSKNL